jgi:SAM-dependent methyltransferase
MLLKHFSTHQSEWKESLNRYIGHILVPLAQERYNNLDWEEEAKTLSNTDLMYPQYYLVPHHGVMAGYLSNWQAFSWELIEHIFGICRVRPTLISLAQATHAQRIVDLGCGTALTSIGLAQLMPEAELILLDLSPYQLVAAKRQVQYYGLENRTQLWHACAEETGFEDEYADLVLASLLFHELPCSTAQAIIQEAQRILTPGGHFLIFDAIQQVVPWPSVDRMINKVLAFFMHEVYWNEYMSEPLWNLCTQQGFINVQRKILFAPPWVYQVVLATK